MNREILFRGKSVDNGEWVEGFIAGLHSYNTDDKTGDITHIDSYYMNHVYPVDASTVGQYTGLTDINGKKIFEGDIVKHTQQYDISGLVVSVGFVKWSNDYGTWIITGFNNDRVDMFLGSETHRVEVIGNIQDNLELLGVAE